MGSDRLGVFFAVNYLAQGLSGIVYEPLSYYLKDVLGLGPGQSAVFTAWMTAPFLVKPALGLVTDLLPWAGRRRVPHITAAAGVTALAWAYLAARPAWSYWGLLVPLIVVNVGLVLSDVICDGVMVERGKPEGKTGAYQALQIGVLYASLVVTGVGGGWLAGHVPMRGIFAMAAVCPLLVLLSALWVSDKPRPDAVRPALAGLRALARSSRFWALGGVIFLWSFNPFLGTAQFFYQSVTLGLDPVFIGFLSTLGGVAGVMGAAAYGRWSAAGGRVESAVRGAVWTGIPLGLLYLVYRGPASVAVITAVTGFAGVFFRLSLMDLAARSCPDYAEATAFAAFISVFNMSAYASNTLGGMLYEGLGGGHPAAGVLAGIGAAATAAGALLLPALSGNAASGVPGR